MTQLTKRLYRSEDNRMVAGVLGGVAKYFDVDPTLVRLIFVVASVVSVAFPGIIVYGLSWMIIPSEG